MSFGAAWNQNEAYKSPSNDTILHVNWIDGSAIVIDCSMALYFAMKRQSMHGRWYMLLLHIATNACAYFLTHSFLAIGYSS